MDEKNNYDDGPYIVVLSQPQCKHLSQTISRVDCIKFTWANSQGDAKVLPPPSKICHCWFHISKVILIYKQEANIVVTSPAGNTQYICKSGCHIFIFDSDNSSDV